MPRESKRVGLLSAAARSGGRRSGHNLSLASAILFFPRNINLYAFE
jgi:hypothetical protein